MNSYQKIIDEYVEDIKEKLENQLELLLVIGSSSSPKVIPKWSDIDVVLVINNYTFEIIEKIKLLSNSYDVKIGTTIYTKKEFDALNIDPKTFYHLYLLNNDKIKLQYISNDLILPTITYEDIKRTHLPYLLWRIHIYKRQFLYDTLTKEQIKNLYKMIYLIMKAILVLDKEFPRNYDETFTLFSKKYNFEYFDYEKFITDYMKDNSEYKNLIDYAKKLLLFIIERY